MCMINDCSEPLQYYIWLSRHPLERYIWHDVFINITGTTVSSLERHCDDDWGAWEQLECDSTSWQPSNSQVPAGPDIMVHMRKMWDKSGPSENVRCNKILHALPFKNNIFTVAIKKCGNGDTFWLKEQNKTADMNSFSKGSKVIIACKYSTTAGTRLTGGHPQGFFFSPCTNYIMELQGNTCRFSLEFTPHTDAGCDTPTGVSTHGWASRWWRNIDARRRWRTNRNPLSRHTFW